MKAFWYFPPLLALTLLPLATAAQGASAHFVIQQATVNGGGGGGTSEPDGAYRMDDSLGQESAIGCSSSFHYVLQSGFWSFLGSGLVPVILMVTKDDGDPSSPELSWTGNNPYYFVYRSTDPSAIFSNLDHTQPGQTWTDGSPPDAPVVFYNILATAPGLISPLSPDQKVVQAGDP